MALELLTRIVFATEVVDATVWCHVISLVTVDFYASFFIRYIVSSFPNGYLLVICNLKVSYTIIIPGDVAVVTCSQII